MKIIQKTLFGDEDITMKLKLGSYEAFTNKFKVKRAKSSDDCYTPPAVYDAVLGWLKERVDLSGREIIRPFYPDSDYRSIPYSENCVVVDNPPFSILRQIVKFYMAHGIAFFLFAPTPTLFSACKGSCCAIVAHARVVYENGAVVNTSFVSNLFPGKKVIISPTLAKAIAMSESIASKRRRSVFLPDNIISSARLSAVLRAAQEDIEIDDKDFGGFCRSYCDVKIFGGGYEVSETIARKLKKIKDSAL